MKINKDNFVIDDEENYVEISVNLRLFPKTVIEKAAYHFINDTNVVVTDFNDKVKIKLVPKNENIKDLSNLAYEFNAELIHTMVIETQAKRYAPLRNALIGTALKELERDSRQASYNEC